MNDVICSGLGGNTSTVKNSNDFPAILRSIRCIGSEEKLTDCSHGGFGDYSCNFIGVAQCAGVLHVLYRHYINYI